MNRNSPCPCGSGRKFKRCCGARAEAESRQAIRQAAKTQVRSLGLQPGDDANQWRRLARFLDQTARDRETSRAELAELSGFDLALVNHALDFSGPFPLEALSALAVVLDVTVEMRAVRTIPEASACLARAVEEHTSLPPWLARCLARGKTATDFKMLATLFAGTEVVVNDVRGEFIHALAIVGEALEREETNDAEALLDTMIRAAEQGELREMSVPTLSPAVQAHLIA